MKRLLFLATLSGCNPHPNWADCEPVLQVNTLLHVYDISSPVFICKRANGKFDVVTP